MRESTVVAEWKAEGIAEGRAEAKRSDLLELLREKFGPSIAPDLVATIEPQADIDVLSRWFRTAIRPGRWRPSVRNWQNSHPPAQTEQSAASAGREAGVSAWKSSLEDWDMRESTVVRSGKPRGKPRALPREKPRALPRGEPRPNAVTSSNCCERIRPLDCP